MQDIKDDFDTRSDEILEYLNLIVFIENAGSEIVDANTPPKKYNVTSEVRKTLKGTVYILLYNLIESTMREAISFIHESLSSKRVEYDQLCESLKKEILRRIRNESVNLDSVFFSTKEKFGPNISLATFNKKKLFSGNIDRDEINSKSKVYGFSTDSRYADTKHGEKLKTIKQHRNDLAHGNVSFAEIGKGVSHSDLEKTCLETIAYLSAIIDNITYYLQSDGYLSNNA